jgi:serine/threonine-protein kinase
MPLSSGTRLGVYEVATKIGEGGMGEVYLARDTTLERDVALKVLPEAFTLDPDRLARFEREAKVLASLNHPNIGGIYGLEEAAGGKARALVLELIQGPTLADRIAQGPIPLDEALAIARQIAEALEAAHERGVIHRDLKPANVKLRDDGTVKVLDFGLAKAIETTTDSDPNQSATVTSPATQMGAVIGTPAYMSPEQARGKTADRRADVWAFGCVLFEMLTGARPFGGSDVSLTLSAVLQLDPDWELLPSTLPRGLATCLRRSLHKDHTQRIQAIGDMRLALDGVFELPEPPVGAPATSRRTLIVAVCVTALVSSAGVWWLSPAAELPPPAVQRFVIDPPEGHRMASVDIGTAAVSPDGRHIVYTAYDEDGPQLFLRSLDQLESVSVTGTRDVARYLFFSPDSSQVGFATTEEGGWTLKRVPLSGGSPLTVHEGRGRFLGGTWLLDDTIVFGELNSPEGTGLMRISVSGGMVEQLTDPDESGDLAHVLPVALPGASSLLFTAIPASGSGAEARVAALSLDAREQTTLVEAATFGVYLASGHLLYAENDTRMLIVPFDLDNLRSTGLPTDVPLFDNSRILAVGADGTLVYVPLPEEGAGLRTLVWVGRDGTEEPLDMDPDLYVTPRISPQEDRIAVDRGSRNDRDVWIYDLNRGTFSPLTLEPSAAFFPAWVPDGRRVVFTSNREGDAYNLYARSADGTGPIERLATGAASQYPYAWFADGRQLAYVVQTETDDFNIHLLSPGADVPSRALLHGEFSESNPTIAPSGNWMAYRSDESGEDEVYVQRFPDLGDRVQISTTGGQAPLWSRDGLELFYLSGRTMMVVPIDEGPPFTVGRPEALFEGPYRNTTARGYDVTGDGMRFLMVKNPDTTAQQRIHIVQNWSEELKEPEPVP